MLARIITALAGVWLMAAPDVLEFDKVPSNNDQIVGPVIASFSIIAIWECTRNVRWFNVPLALWLFVSPWALGYENITAILNNMGVGLVVMLLSFIAPIRTTSFAGGWPAVWRSNVKDRAR